MDNHDTLDSELASINSGFEKNETNRRLRMAGFGPRWGAFLVDANIFFLIAYFFFGSVFSLLRTGNFKPSELGDSFAMAGVVLYLFGIPLMIIIYRAVFECSRFQGTPGKIAVKIKVVDQLGNKISFGRALGRNLGRLLSSFILYIGYFMTIWTEKKQALHDIMANTYVVMKD